MTPTRLEELQRAEDDAARRVHALVDSDHALSEDEWAAALEDYRQAILALEKEKQASDA